MHRLRVTIVATLALALAALPVAGLGMSAAASEAPAASVHVDCCTNGQPCAMQSMAGDAQSGHAKGHCGDHAACGGKCLCLALTAVLSASTGALSTRMPLVKTARVVESTSSPAYIPPSPPPRV